ncbi:SUA5-like protein [Deinococcus sedimenti]|uniref:L-threonylcarbamoyladenylate synthase n=2 Tax=Deinococcus sedimenti TaxID=1867090 RepID=A0ABQ2S2K1_9DEIO|nr:SUA5-like protein [Deinococcus sedimenti]
MGGLPDDGTKGLLSPEWERGFVQAETVLRQGGLVAYPSETVWGLAALPGTEGVARLYAVKGRLAEKPVQGSFASVETAERYVQLPVALRRLVSFLPGPLTVVTDASPLCPVELAPGGRVGIRVPDHPVALELLGRVGGVLATTSCNRSGEPPALSYDEAVACGLADLVLPDGGVPARGVPSTVLDLSSCQILREGAVPAATLLAALEVQS